MLEPIPRHPGHWLTGSYREIMPRVHRFVIDAARQHGGLVRFRVLHRTVYATVRPQDARHILIDNVDNYVKSYHFRNASRVSGLATLFIDGEDWRRQRRGVQPGFRRTALQTVADVAARECAAVIDGWRGAASRGEPVDALAAMRTVGIRTMTRMLLGIGLGDGPADRFAATVADALDVIIRRNFGVALPYWIPTPPNRAVDNTRKILDDFLLPLIRERRAALEDGRETPGGILESYIAHEDFTEQAVLDETKTLFTAGFETTATSLAWALHLLAQHPSTMAWCIDEVDSVLGGRLPTITDISNLPRITAVAQEALRLYPPIVQVGRESLEADDLGGYRLPKGATILVSLFGILRSPEHWDEPDAFKPERFLAREENELRDLMYIPFGAGRRTCIGNHFAHLEQIAVLATVLQRYRLEPVAGHEVKERMRVTLQPGTALPLWAVERGKAA